VGEYVLKYGYPVLFIPYNYLRSSGINLGRRGLLVVSESESVLYSTQPATKYGVQSTDAAIVT
jgi:hypothetical protein